MRKERRNWRGSWRNGGPGRAAASTKNAAPRPPAAKKVAPIQSPPPEEPTAILYGDMRDVGGRVEVFSFGSTDLRVTSSRRSSAGCTASPTTTAKKWHDLFDKSIKCLKAGRRGDTGGSPSATPLSLSHATRRGGLWGAPKKLTNNPVAATSASVSRAGRRDAPQQRTAGRGGRTPRWRLSFAFVTNALLNNRPAPSRACPSSKRQAPFSWRDSCARQSQA